MEILARVRVLAIVQFRSTAVVESRPCRSSTCRFIWKRMACGGTRLLCVLSGDHCSLWISPDDHGIIAVLSSGLQCIRWITSVCVYWPQAPLFNITSSYLRHRRSIFLCTYFSCADHQRVSSRLEEHRETQPLPTVPGVFPRSITTSYVLRADRRNRSFHPPNTF